MSLAMRGRPIGTHITRRVVPAVRVRVLHMTECPATPATIQLVEGVAGAMDIPVILEQVLVDTPEQAQALGFLGSPTVQVDGRDVERRRGVGRTLA